MSTNPYAAIRPGRIKFYWRAKKGGKVYLEGVFHEVAKYIKMRKILIEAVAGVEPTLLTPTPCVQAWLIYQFGLLKQIQACV